MSDQDSSEPPRRVSLVDRILRRTPAGGPDQLTRMLETKTDEGIQEMMPRERSSPRELFLESGSLLLPEGIQLNPADIDVEAPEDETMILNLGPSHPSTHGVLRVMVELSGETVLRSKPVVG
jgi:NADH-quinone oxidoreductase subunit D